MHIFIRKIWMSTFWTLGTNSSQIFKKLSLFLMLPSVIRFFLKFKIHTCLYEASCTIIVLWRNDLFLYLFLTDMYTMAFLVWTKASSDWSVKWCIWEWTRDACSSVGSSALSHSSRFNLKKKIQKILYDLALYVMIYRKVLFCIFILAEVF